MVAAQIVAARIGDWGCVDIGVRDQHLVGVLGLEHSGTQLDLHHAALEIADLYIVADPKWPQHQQQHAGRELLYDILQREAKRDAKDSQAGNKA
jgi:hypothetical protein